MTDYEQGFAQGEAVAWMQRHEPLPPKGQILNERERGYWDARLPRTAEWARSSKRFANWYPEAA
jgi:hypothetical protein